MDKDTTKSTFVKVLNRLPLRGFRKQITENRLDKYTKKLYLFKLLQIMIFAQIAQIESYAELSERIKNDEDLQKLLDFNSISVSQLSRRTGDIDSDFWQIMYSDARNHVTPRLMPTISSLRYNERINIVDASTIVLCLNSYRWADYRTTKAGIKLHQSITYMDGNTYPSEAMLTTARASDISQLDELISAELNTLNVFDRGYVDYRKWDEYCDEGIRFVTRLKSSFIVNVIEEIPVDNSTMQESVVTLGDPKTTGMRNRLRLIRITDTKGNSFDIVTNDLKISPQEISDVYRRRWQIELFFKWIKQHLKIKKFFGKSENAVYAQIWLALITYCLLLLVKTTLSTNLSLLNIQRLLQVMLFKPYDAFLERLQSQQKRASPRGKRSIIDHNEQFEQLLRQVEVSGSAYLDENKVEMNYL